MKTRFSPIVKLKHSKVQEEEATLQQALSRLQNAKEALAQSIEELESLKEPTTGDMQSFLAARTLLDAQFRLIEKNENWVAFEEAQVEACQEALKNATIEYEKFKYLESEEIKKIKKALSLKEAKRLDELAMIGFNQKAKEAV